MSVCSAAEKTPRTRSVVMAARGMVATSQPLATQAGLDVLRAGGTAADAAIAANVMLGLVEPMSCGLGGDLFVIYWDAKTKTLHGLNACGRSPYAHTRELFAKLDLKEIPLHGPFSWTVPGCVDGWETLHKKFGKLPLRDFFAASIQYGEEGFAVTEVIADQWRHAEEHLRDWPDSASTFLIDGKAPRAGQVFRNPRLAAAYKLLSTDGAKAFYRGAIAEKIVAFSQANGGHFSLRDFAEHRSDWIAPVSTNYRGYDVWELPPNGQGIAALQMLNLLEPYDLKSMGRTSADYLHLLTEAKKLAFADRARFYADPNFYEAPIKQLISKEYAAQRRKLINVRHAAKSVDHGDSKLIHGDTVYLTVVDGERNCCSFIQSNYVGFGSQMTPGDLGFPLQNRGCLFALDDEHPNRLEPHKRPFHTIIPGFVSRGGKPWFCFGVMGGDMQPQGHVQVLVNMIDFGLDVQQASDALRVRHDGSSTPTGKPGDKDGGMLLVEAGISDTVIAELRERGHRVLRAKGQAFGGYQGIFIDLERGVLHGGSDHRKDGCAMGW